ncbi:MAG TPA: hypothetical protein PKE40_08825 [Arachnia sp.]|nr:hypothetical protein [Arachnia sp.]HMT86441.1 hypothetical protein [Arachnia sp.]
MEKLGEVAEAKTRPLAWGFPSIVRLVTLGGLLSLIAQFYLAYKDPDSVSSFPALFPQLVVLLVLVVISGVWGRGWVLRGLVMIAAVLLAAILLFFSYTVLGFTAARPAQLCTWIFDDLPEERRAELSLPADTWMQPAVEFSWPGDVTCIWPAEEVPEEPPPTEPPAEDSPSPSPSAEPPGDPSAEPSGEETPGDEPPVDEPPAEDPPYEGATYTQPVLTLARHFGSLWRWQS